jgi:hypothetical protein
MGRKMILHNAKINFATHTVKILVKSNEDQIENVACDHDRGRDSFFELNGSNARFSRGGPVRWFKVVDSFLGKVSETLRRGTWRQQRDGAVSPSQAFSS